MPEDKQVLSIISKILQRYQRNADNKKKQERTQRGLESKLRDPQSSLTAGENALLNSQLSSANNTT